MIDQSTLTLYMHDLLQCDQYTDYAPNGLQIEGKDQIQRICTAVTASLDVISRAIALNADALLVHHGYFWRGESPIIAGMKRQRISQLLQYQINLYAYHLPLDCQDEWGNNAEIAQLLSVQEIKKHAIGAVPNLLWSGVLAEAMSGEQLDQFIESKLKRKPLYLCGHKRKVKSIAWCTGGAQDYIDNAKQLGVDAYLSGEVSERTYYQAKELGIHYYSCGHHATERYGIQALGRLLATKFDLQHTFIDSDNPI